MVKKKNPKTFKDVYKFPLQFDPEFSIKVFTADSHMAFDFFTAFHTKRFPTAKNIKLEDKAHIVALINGADYKKIQNFTLEYNPNRAVIYAIDEEGTKNAFILVRGWGNLTGIGGHNLLEEDAVKLQTEFAEYIIKQLTDGK